MALIEQAAELMTGREPVTLRRVAAAAETSTMSIYTQFGGMSGLWRAVRQEGFTRLAHRLVALEHTDDPVRDLMAFGSAYVGHAVANPDLYRMMFEIEFGLDDDVAAEATFQMLVAGAERARVAGRFSSMTDPRSAAIQLWGMTHGMVMLVLSGALADDTLVEQLPSMVAAAFVGFGDEPDLARTSTAAGWRSPVRAAAQA